MNYKQKSENLLKPVAICTVDLRHEMPPEFLDFQTKMVPPPQGLYIVNTTRPVVLPNVLYYRSRDLGNGFRVSSLDSLVNQIGSDNLVTASDRLVLKNRIIKDRRLLLAEPNLPIKPMELMAITLRRFVNDTAPFSFHDSPKMFEGSVFLDDLWESVRDESFENLVGEQLCRIAEFMDTGKNNMFRTITRGTQFRVLMLGNFAEYSFLRLMESEDGKSFITKQLPEWKSFKS